MDQTPQRLEYDFNEKFRGYDIEEVDAFLLQVSATLADLVREKDEAAARAAGAENEVRRLREEAANQPAPAPAPVAPPVQQVSSDEATAGEAARTLMLASQTAERAVAEAKADASRIVSDATASATTTQRDAQVEADRIVGEARVTAEQMTQKATAQAAREYGARRDEILAEIGALENQRAAGATQLAAVESRIEEYRTGLAMISTSIERVLDEPETMLRPPIPGIELPTPAQFFEPSTSEPAFADASPFAPTTEVPAAFAAEPFSTDAFTAEDAEPAAYSAEPFSADQYSTEAFSSEPSAFSSEPIAESYDSDAYTTESPAAEPFAAEAFSPEPFAAEPFAAESPAPSAYGSYDANEFEVDPASFVVEPGSDDDLEPLPTGGAFTDPGNDAFGASSEATGAYEPVGSGFVGNGLGDFEPVTTDEAFSGIDGGAWDAPDGTSDETAADPWAPGSWSEVAGISTTDEGFSSDPQVDYGGDAFAAGNAAPATDFGADHGAGGEQGSGGNTFPSGGLPSIGADRYSRDLDEALNTENEEDDAMAKFFEGDDDRQTRRFGRRR